MSRVKGEVTVGQLCAASGLGKEKTTNMIERLLRFGLLTAVNGDYVAREDDDLFGDAGEENDEDLFGAPSESEDDLFGAPEEDDDDLFGGGAPDVPLFATPSEQTELMGGQTSFADSLLSVDEGEEDDLFQSGSIAHKSRLGARPVSAVETPSLGAGSTRRAAALVPESQIDVPPVATTHSGEREHTGEREVQLKDGPTEYSVEDRPNYESFPTPFDDWQNPNPPIMGVHPELQKEVHYVHAHLEQLTYYHFFGIPLDADRKTVRASYFKYSKRFHPDLFFGQDVGDLGSKAEAVFKYATKAYETLGKKKKRVEYDEALQSLMRQSQNSEVIDTQRRSAAQTTLGNRAKDLASRGDFEKAAQEIRRALALGPNRDLALEGANILLRANVRLDEAATYARAALKQRPDDTSAMVMLGKIYEQNGMLNDAMTMYERALGFAPDDASIRVHVERVKTLAG